MAGDQIFAPLKLQEVPVWLMEQVRTTYVDPPLITLLHYLPTVIHLTVKIKPSERVPAALSGLLKATGICQQLSLKSLTEVSDEGEQILIVSSEQNQIKLWEPWMSGDLGELINHLVEQLVPPAGLAELHHRLAMIGTIASTLHSITTAMLASYDEDKAIHVLLTGMTAGYGLGFNRAVFFRYVRSDGEAKGARLVGHAAVGPSTEEEAHAVWERIEAHAEGIDEFIAEYDAGMVSSRIESKVRTLTIPVAEAGEEVTSTLVADEPIHFKETPITDPRLAELSPSDEYVLAPVRAHGRLLGLIFADDRYVKRQIGQLRLQNLRFFIDQTALILENLKLLEKQRALATTDPLTGVLNRRELDRTLEYAVRSAMSEDKVLSLLVLDIDHFKTINDTHGHLEGDRILVGVADAIRAVTRTEDLVARFGGDEFVVVLVGNQTASEAIAERIQNGVKENLDVTVSIGLALMPDDAQTAMALFHVADERLFAAKRSKKSV